MLVLDTGAAIGAASVGIAVYANAGNSGLPDDIEIARAHLGEAWPAGVALDEQPQLLGEFALGPGYLAQVPHGPQTVALAWHRDDAEVGRPEFRALDVASWDQGQALQIAPTGDAVFSFVAGAGVAVDGAWNGDGFAISWRNVGAPGVGPARPLGALLDARGNVLRGPSALAFAENFPGRAPMLVWTGSNYLVATTYDDCPDVTVCASRSVVVAKIAPSSYPAGGFAVVPVTALPVLDPSSVPGGSASLAAFDGNAWVAWTEGPPAEAGARVARVVRVAMLDAQGRLEGSPVTVEAQAYPASHVSVSASEVGIILTWAEDAAGTGTGQSPGDVVPGASFVVAQRVGFDGAVDAPVRIPATRVDDYGPPTSSAIAAPRGVLVLWAGRSTVATHFDVTYLARLDCAKPNLAR
jgi:hypothetical protein